MKICGTGSCQQRAAALRIQGVLCERKKDLKCALVAFLKRDHVQARELPPGDRAHARSRKSWRLCDKYAARHNDPDCHRLERKVTGAITYRDQSLQKPMQELNPAQISIAYERYRHLLQACFNSAVRKNSSLVGIEFVLKWVVNEKGRVEQIHLESFDRRPDSGFLDSSSTV